MYLRFLLFAAPLLALFLGCQNMGLSHYLQAVKGGQLYFSDGASQAIPHWGDPEWAHFFCVRHAEKAKDDPKDPILTAEGMARAERLGRIMAEAGLDSVYATPYRRNQLTAEPVQRRGKTAPIVTYKPEDQEIWLLELLKTSKGKKLMIVGHQNTIPQLLNQLKGDGFTYENIPDPEFGLLYLVATKGVGQTEILEVRY